MSLEHKNVYIKKYSRRSALGIAGSAVAATVLSAACGHDAVKSDQIPQIGTTPVSTEVVPHSEAVNRLVKDLIPSRVSIPSINLKDISVNRTPLDEKQKVPVVSDHGGVTPDFKVLSMENKIWIFGHSSWQGVPQDLYRLQDINKGDEVVIDVQERETQKRYDNLKFTIQDLVLTDTDGGTDLLNSGEAPIFPYLMMQTSVREDGVGKKWILNRDLLMSKARVLIEGDIDDPTKYLLLFANGLIRFDQIARLQG